MEAIIYLQIINMMAL